MAPLERDIGLRGRVTRELMRNMFMHKLKSGDRLVINKVAAQLQASATPVREALVELHGLGLVELIPDRGAVCLPFGEEQLREMHHLRGVLEAEAARLATPRLPAHRLQAMHADLKSLEASDSQQPGWSEAALRTDMALHDLIATWCGSRRLHHEIEQYREMMACLREVIGNRLNLQVTALGEHLVIVEALLAKDADRAAAAIAAHSQHSGDRAARILFPAAETLSGE
jgi:DNA-binding GntR family transcriptional regulator